MPTSDAPSNGTQKPRRCGGASACHWSSGLLCLPLHVPDCGHASREDKRHDSPAGSNSGKRGLPKNGTTDPGGKPNNHGDQSDNDHVVHAVVAGSSGCGQRRISQASSERRYGTRAGVNPPPDLSHGVAAQRASP